jgi:hypothetical protein
VIDEHPSASVRVSVATLLRVRTGDQRLVLVDTGGAVIGPFGGALAYHRAAGPLLDGLGWRPEREPAGPLVDLRGVLPARSFPAFVAWFEGGRDRESGEQGLRREVVEELDEAGLHAVAGLVAGAELAHVRTVTEEPALLAARGMVQTRRLEVYDLLAGALADRLVALAADPGVATVLAVSEADIAAGRVGSARIGTQAAYLAAEFTDRPGVSVATGQHR